MVLANTKPVEIDQPALVRPPIPPGDWQEFAGHLARKHSITGDLLSKFGPTGSAEKDRKLRDLWELTDLSAHDFADEVAAFYKLPRLTLPQLVGGSADTGAVLDSVPSRRDDLSLPNRGQWQHAGCRRPQRCRVHPCRGNRARRASVNRSRFIRRHCDYFIGAAR